MLIDLIENLNFLIRRSDIERHSGDPLKSEIIIYKTASDQRKLRALLESVDLTQQQSLENIAELARKVVNSQHFHDGNHRTALFLCYFLSLHCNHELLRIQPYLLYASIDFEYFKSIYSISQSQGVFFGDNAIHTACTSRAISNVSHIKNTDMLIEKIKSDILNMAANIECLSKEFCNKTHTPAVTTKSKLFRQFAGFRESMEHSTVISVGYISSLKKRCLLEAPYDPRLDLNQAHKKSAVLPRLFKSSTVQEYVENENNKPMLR